MDSSDYFRRVHSFSQPNNVDNQCIKLGFDISDSAPRNHFFLLPARIPQGSLYSPRQMLAIAQYYRHLPHEFVRETTLNHETKFSGA